MFLIYTISFLSSTAFWMGIWALYYLRFTNFTGIGLIESIMIATRVLSEIPTGAFADLFGRKNSLILAFIVMGVGNIIMGFSASYQHLILGVLIITIGQSFFSGTFEAYLFDFLKNKGREEEYLKRLSYCNALMLISVSISTLLGSLLVLIRSLPYQTIINVTSNVLNKHIPSSHRATALSAFNLLKSIPYIALAVLIGYLMDIITAQWLAFIIGITLIGFVGSFSLIRHFRDVHIISNIKNQISKLHIKM